MKYIQVAGITAACFALGFADTSTALAALVTNPSFENDIVPAYPGYGTIDGWTRTAPNGGVNDASGPFHNLGTAIPDGSRVAFVQMAGKLSQNIVNLTPEQQYQIHFFYDVRDYWTSKADITVSFDGNEVGKLVNVVPSTTGHYYEASFLFTPEHSTGLLSFESKGDFFDTTVLYDNVSITAVPEPSTYIAGLGAVGMLGLFGWRNRN